MSGHATHSRNDGRFTGSKWTHYAVGKSGLIQVIDDVRPTRIIRGALLRTIRVNPIEPHEVELQKIFIGKLLYKYFNKDNGRILF